MESSAGVLEDIRPPEREETHFVGYKEFKALTPEQIASESTVVTGMRPDKLFASQEWVSPSKINRALDRPASAKEGEPEVVEGYYYDNPHTGQRAIVLGDGHHRALQAHERGSKVDVKIKGPLPDGSKAISFSRFYRGAGKVF